MGIVGRFLRNGIEFRKNDFSRNPLDPARPDLLHPPLDLPEPRREDLVVAL
jgi:hypothetical protein